MHIVFAVKNTIKKLSFFGGKMNLRICPNCGESCEKEYETVIVRSQEFCVCCNYNLSNNLNDEDLNKNYFDDIDEKNNAFIEFFNESGLLKSQKL